MSAVGVGLLVILVGIIGYLLWLAYFDNGDMFDDEFDWDDNVTDNESKSTLPKG